MELRPDKQVASVYAKRYVGTGSLLFRYLIIDERDSSFKNSSITIYNL